MNTPKDSKYTNWNLIIGNTVGFFIYFLEMVISIYIISREFVNPQIVICVLVVASQFPFLMSNTKKKKGLWVYELFSNRIHHMYSRSIKSSLKKIATRQYCKILFYELYRLVSTYLYSVVTTGWVRRFAL